MSPFLEKLFLAMFDFGKDWPGWGAWWKVVKTNSSSPLPQEMNYSLFTALREISRWSIKMICFCRYSIVVFTWNKKTKQTNKENKSNCICHLCRMEFVWVEYHLYWDRNRKTLKSHWWEKMLPRGNSKKLAILKSSK